MPDAAWVSAAFADPTQLRSLRNDVGEAGMDDLSRIRQKIESGKPLADDEFPSEIFAAPDAPDTLDLPNLFFGYGCWIVSAAATTVLASFDLGHGALRPVRVLRKDRATPIGQGFHAISFGNVKRSFLPASSPRMKPTKRGGGGWKPPFVLKNDDIALSRAALDGPDIWIEEQIVDCFFTSDALARALKKAGTTSGFNLKRCLVSETQDA